MRSQRETALQLDATNYELDGESVPLEHHGHLQREKLDSLVCGDEGCDASQHRERTLSLSLNHLHPCDVCPTEGMVSLI